MSESDPSSPGSPPDILVSLAGGKFCSPSPPQDITNSGKNPQQEMEESPSPVHSLRPSSTFVTPSPTHIIRRSCKFRTPSPVTFHQGKYSPSPPPQALNIGSPSLFDTPSPFKELEQTLEDISRYVRQIPQRSKGPSLAERVQEEDISTLRRKSRTLFPQLSSTAAQPELSDVEVQTPPAISTSRVAQESPSLQDPAFKNPYSSAKRFKRDHLKKGFRTVLRNKLMGLKYLRPLRRLTCCQKKCLQTFTFSAIRNTRHSFLSMTRGDQEAYLAINVRPEDGDSFSYYVMRKTVCQLAFKSIHAIGSRRMARVQKRLDANPRIDDYCHPQKAVGMYCLEAKAWLVDFFDSNCERLPNSPVYHLMDSFCKKEIYSLYKDLFQASGQKFISYSYFLRLWKQEFNLVRIPKRHRFSVCATCSLLKEKRSLTKVPAERSKYLSCDLQDTRCCTSFVFLSKKWLRMFMFSLTLRA